jgi:agmatine deiminase
MNANLKMHYIPTSIPENSPESSGEGIYINFLNLEDMIIMPSYNNPTDKEAARVLTKLYDNKPVQKVYAGDLSKEGGMINCVTWIK